MSATGKQTRTGSTPPPTHSSSALAAVSGAGARVEMGKQEAPSTFCGQGSWDWLISRGYYSLRSNDGPTNICTEGPSSISSISPPCEHSLALVERSVLQFSLINSTCIPLRSGGTLAVATRGIEHFGSLCSPAARGTYRTCLRPCVRARARLLLLGTLRLFLSPMRSVLPCCRAAESVLGVLMC